MERHFHADLAVLVDALEIDVQHFVTKRMHLHVAQQNALRCLAERHGQNGGMKRFPFQGIDQGIVIELYRLRLADAAIDDARRPSGQTKTAACAPAFPFARECSE